MNEERVEQVIDVDQPMDGTVPNGDGVNEVTVQDQVQIQPQLFDVDLERIHVDLYRDKYLTPDDFLDDIRKIVHNTNVRANEDPERLFRAQAMLTYAEVSVQNFDANFRLECQRAATREAKRREIYKQNKAKERAEAEGAQNGASSLPIRRSARNTGQQPELPITDPLKLERRLKRARSKEASAERSEEEGGDEAHAAKRSRVSSAEVEQGPATEVIGSPPSRPHAVRFVDDVNQKEEPSSPTPHANDPVSEFPVHTAEDAPRRNGGGFDPALLNPMSPTTEQQIYPLAAPVASLSDLTPNDVLPALPNGFSEHHPSAVPQEGPSAVDAQMSITENPVAAAPSPVPEPMQIERTPTPLPDFVVSEEELSHLRAILRDKTATLNVEQLEQLRATCLTVVWQHRADWDRSGLIRELRGTVEKYVDEVNLDDMDSSSPSYEAPPAFSY